MPSTRPILAYFGHHKGASQWLSRMLRAVCTDTGLRFSEYSLAHQFEYDLPGTLQKNGADFVAYTNAESKYLDPIANYRAVHVVRDPRDVVVSGYFSHLHSHPAHYWPELREHRANLEKVPIDEGLFLEMEFCKNFKQNDTKLNLFEALENWNYSHPNVLELRFEEITKNPYQSFTQILNFLGFIDERSQGWKNIWRFLTKATLNRLHGKGLFPFKVGRPQIPEWRGLSIAHENSFKKLSGGRKQGDEANTNHYRKGTPGDWKRYFKEEHKEFFKKNYNDLLVKLNYEANENW